MTANVLLEAAFRSGLMGVVIYLMLRLLRIQQARAQRGAWLLALLGACIMPALVALHIGPKILPSTAVFSPRVLASTELVSGPLAPRRISQLTPEDDGAASPSVQVAAADSGSTLWKGILYSYCAVAAVLTLRLATGAGIALRRRQLGSKAAIRLDEPLDIRVSDEIRTPVTIASSVLLPPTFVEWDESTLRVVLLHERAHVRQLDFYVQLLAGLHCAIFWFSPFSWYVQRRLADLGEALSDHAAVAQAPSRESYAQTLLDFAAVNSGSWSETLCGAPVSMARGSNLTPRIERLLDDQNFHKTFSGTQLRQFVALGVVALALALSTALVRAQGPQAPDVDAQSDTHIEHSKDDQTLAIRIGDSQTIFQGQYDRDVKRIQRTITGDYIYFRDRGTAYVTQDPAIIAQAKTLLAPMGELSLKQRELGNEQTSLGMQQEQLGRQQSTQKIAAVDFRDSISDLDEIVKEMKSAQASTQISPEVLADLQSRMGEIQGRLGELQGEASAKQGDLGEQQGRLGEMQDKLGEEQGRLGEQQAKLADQVRKQLRPVLEQAIRDGRMKSVHAASASRPDPTTVWPS